MKLTVKTLVFVIASALAACSADDDTPIGGGVDNPIDSHLLPIKLAVGDAPQTRAADGLLKDNFPSGTDINVVIDGNEYSYKTNEPGKELTCTNNPIPYYAIGSKSVSIKAFYPALEKGWYNRTSTFGWVVNNDQTSDGNYKWSDKMYATVPSSYSGLDADGKVTPTKNVVPLKFYHLMAKVVLNVTTPDANTKIKKVTLNSVKTRYQMDCVNCRAFDAYFDSNNTAGVITVYNNANGATGTVTCAAVFPPQTISSDVNFITVTTTDATIYYKLPQSVNFTSGQQYTFSLSTYVDKSGYKVGNVICSDGSMCDYNQLNGKTPVAVIVYVGSNTGNSTYCHGLAIKLKKEANTETWSRFTTTCSNPIQMTGTTPPVEDGLSYRNSKYTNITNSNNYTYTDYPAFYSAIRPSVATPPNTSGWFLGSAYQWEQIMKAMGKTDTERYNNLSTFFSKRGGDEIASTYYGYNVWTCTEYDKEYAWTINLNVSSSNKTYQYSFKKEHKDSDTWKWAVRAMLAF